MLPRIDSMSRFEEEIQEPDVVGDCAQCGGELYEGDAVDSTVDEEVTHDTCTDSFLRARYIERSGRIN